MSSAHPVRNGERWCLAALLLIALVVRVVCVYQYVAQHPGADFPVIDEASYDSWGARIAQGDWLGSEVFFQEPLYPYFLGGVYSVLGHDLMAVRLLQCLLGAATVFLVFRLTRRLFGPLASWVAGAGLALYGPAVLLPCLLLKPNLFLPLLVAFAWLLVLPGSSLKRLFAMGVLGGLGALLRGNMLLLLPFIAAWMATRAWREGAGLPRAAQHFASFAGGAALVLLPVLVRNYTVGGVFALTTSGAGTNVYGGNNSHNPLGVATEFDWVRGIPEYEAEDWQQEARRRTGRELSATEVSDFWLGEALSSMRRDPVLHAKILWNKLRLALGAYEVPDNHLYEWDRRHVSLLRWPWPGFGLWGSLGLAGVLWWLGTRKEGACSSRPAALALLFLAYLATIVLTVMSSRARLPLVVLILPFAGFFVAELRRREQRAGIPVAVLFLACGVVFWPVIGSAARAKDLDERDYNLAVQRGAEGQLVEARSLALGLVERYPRSARLRILLADLDWRAGRIKREAGQEQEGRALIRSALRSLQETVARDSLVARERSRAYRLAGFVQADLGKLGAAERFFARAREFAPRDSELWLAHLRVRVELCMQRGAEQGSACLEELHAELERLIEAHPTKSSAAEARALLRTL